MADSNITKRALASALKALMQEEPFAKISISDICKRCDMNRNSFYYHFADKYELVNWIFDTEFVTLISDKSATCSHKESVELLEKICTYFYENQAFYRKALQIKGQNSFSDHFREFVRPLMEMRMVYLLGQQDVDDFEIDFFVDAMLCALVRWLLNPNCMPPKQFVAKLMSIITRSSEVIQKQLFAEKQ